MVPQELLNTLQDAQERLLPGLGVYREAVEASDGRGGVERTFLARPTPVACRIGEPTTKERAAYGQRLDISATWAITMPSDVPANEGDQIVLNGVTYEIVMVVPHHDWTTATRVMVKAAG